MVAFLKFRNYTALFLILHSFMFCLGQDNLEDKPTLGNHLIFQSGFESDSELVEFEGEHWDMDIVGSDRSAVIKNDWVSDLEGHPKIGHFSIQYQDGDSTMRKAEIIDDPTKSGNRVLRYWMHSPNVGLDKAYGGKFRIQSNLYGNTDLREFTYKVRLYLSEDWNEIRKSEKEMSWFILAEYWNNAAWTKEDYIFRIHLMLNKGLGSNNPIRFSVGAQAKDSIWNSIWHEENENFALPVGKWMTLAIYMKEGGRDSGRYILTVTPEGAAPEVIFDVINFTHHPEDPFPNGFTHLNPMKGYSHRDNIYRVKRKRKTLQFYWDDFALWEGRLK